MNKLKQFKTKLQNLCKPSQQQQSDDNISQPDDYDWSSVITEQEMMNKEIIDPIAHVKYKIMLLKACYLRYEGDIKLINIQFRKWMLEFYAQKKSCRKGDECGKQVKDVMIKKDKKTKNQSRIENDQLKDKEKEKLEVDTQKSRQSIKMQQKDEEKIPFDNTKQYLQQKHVKKHSVQFQKHQKPQKQSSNQNQYTLFKFYSNMKKIAVSIKNKFTKQTKNLSLCQKLFCIKNDKEYKEINQDQKYD